MIEHRLRKSTRLLAVALVSGGAFLIASAAGASTPLGGYAREAALVDSVASQGITYGGVHKRIAEAHCRGLTHYGVRHSGSRSFYHRLECTLTGQDGHSYEAQVVILTSSSKGFSWRILSGKRH
jgi:hypothetical protein